jgi:ankyrin repeat protein
VKLGNTRKAAKLVNEGADINFKDEEGLSLLHRAVLSQNEDMIRWLLAAGADVEATIKGQTPLFYAVSLNFSLSIIELLMSYGASPTSVSAEHWTPLNLAVHRGNMEVARPWSLPSTALSSTWSGCS